MMKQTRCYRCDKPIEAEWLPEGGVIICDECLSYTDELSVEKLQEQLNTAKKALTNIKLRTERDELETYYVERNHDIRKDAIDALAAIGWDGCPVGLIVKNGLTKEELEGSGDE